MNLAIRGIEGQIAHGDSFHNDRHPDMKADFILANPPFNVSDWGGERLADDKRWRYGVPPKGNANFAWVQHMVHHLAPAGVAGFVLANGSMSSSQSGEGTIRKNLVEADGAAPQPDDGEPFEAKMKRLVAELQAQQAEGARLDAAIAENLKAIGFPLRGHGS